MKAQPRFLTHDSQRLLLTGYGLGTTSRAVVIVPPFAEELNKCRRMMALQAKALAAAGTPCCYLDFSGTGDSEGEFADVRVTHWTDQLQMLTGLLRTEYGVDAPDLLGVRLGALLAVQYARRSDALVRRLVFWQPVAEGGQYLKQFLRTRVMASAIGAGAGRESIADLRRALATTGYVEVAGYRLSDALARDLESLSLSELPQQLAQRTHWIEVQGGQSPVLSPASRRYLEQMPAGLHSYAVSGEPFWSTVEIGSAPALVDLSCSILGGSG